VALQKTVNDRVLKRYYTLLKIRVQEQLRKHKPPNIQVTSTCSSNHEPLDSKLTKKSVEMPRPAIELGEQASQEERQIPNLSKIVHDHTYSLSPTMGVGIEKLRDLLIMKPKPIRKIKTVSRKHKRSSHYKHPRQRMMALKAQRSIANAKEIVNRKNALLAEQSKLAHQLAMPVISSEDPQPTHDSILQVALRELGQSPLSIPTPSTSSPSHEPVPEATDSAPVSAPEIKTEPKAKLPEVGCTCMYIYYMCTCTCRILL